MSYLMRTAMALASSVWITPAFACTAVHSDAAQTAMFDGSDTNTGLLNESFIAEINAHRCDHGLTPLTYDETLEQASAYHSDWMSRERVFAHESTIQGMEAPWNRALHFGYAYSTVAENLALHPRFAFQQQSFYVTGTCEFERVTGEVISPSSYAELAHEVAIGWMNSPPHRANILLDSISEGAVGIAIDYGAEHCGKIYVTMLYGHPASQGQDS